MSGSFDFAFIFYGIMNAAFAIAVSPLFMGIIKKTKALSQGRKGPPVFQQYYNIAKLLKKESVYSGNSSRIMSAAPMLNIAALLTAALFVPLFFIPPQTDLAGNIILFLYLLALAKFFMALSGLDAGSAFGGMGSSREMSLSAVIEPVTIIVFAGLAFVLKTSNIIEMFRQAAFGFGVLSVDAALFPILIALFIVLIAETARVPVDNPETHLELTMIHEAMILEQSGKNLCLMELSHAIKQTLLMAIIINIFAPFGIAMHLGAAAIIAAMAAFLAKGAFLSIAVGIFESSFAKLRLFRLPNYFMIAFFLALLTILFEVFV